MAIPDNLKNVKQDLQDINELASTLESSFVDISKATSEFAKSSEDSAESIKIAGDITKAIGKSAQALAGFSEDNLKNLKDVNKLEKSREGLKQAQRRLDAKILELQAKKLGATRKEQRSLDKTIEALDNARIQTQQLSRGFEDILETSEKIEKSSPFASLGDLISEIPVLRKIFPEFQKAAQTFRDSVIDGKKGIVAFGKASTQAIGAFSKLASLELLRRGVTEADLLQKRVVGFRRELGLSAEEASELQVSMSKIANASGEAFFNSARFAESQQEINKTLGTNLTISGDLAENFSLLVYRLGLSAEEATKFNLVSKAAGKNARDFTGEIKARTMLLNGENKLQIDNRQILKDISTISARTQLSFRAQNIDLVKATYNARKLGISLKDAEGIADSLLSFESSISNELEAELLTGRQLNLETAREAALRGDLATVTSEVAKNVGSAAEFGNMNRIQQQAIAKAVGMTADQLAESLLFQENISKLSAESAYRDAESLDDLKAKVALRAKEVDENGKQIGFQKALSEIGNEELRKQIDAVTVQEQLAEKQASAADAMIAAMGPNGLNATLGGLTKAIDALTIAVVALSAIQLGKTVADVAKGGKRMFDFFKGSSKASKEIAENVGKTASNIAKTTKGTIGKGVIGRLGSSGGRQVLKRAGKIGLKQAGKSIVKKIPIVGALAGLGFAISRAAQGDYLGAAGELASGVASTIPGLGTAASVAIDAGLAARDISQSRSRSNPQSIGDMSTQDTAADFISRPGQPIQKFRKDDIIVGGTNLRGGDNNEVISLLKELISEVRAGGDVYIDGSKVGKTLQLANSRMG